MEETGKNQELDQDEVNAFASNVWNYKQGEVVSLMIHLGDRLGIYQALDGAGLVTPGELAEKMGLKERWLLEWLRGQAAAKLLTYHSGDRFELTAVGSAVLADERNSLQFAAGAFGVPISPEIVDRLAEAFQTGIGMTYQQLGPNAAHRTERMLGPWSRMALVPTVIPALDGVAEKLEKGAIVADVGCGGGIALLAIAKAFPNSEFHGYDPTSHAIENANKKVAAEGIRNAEFHVVRGEEIPQEPTFDFMITLDCIHDMTHPERVIASIRKAIKSDGTWLIKDIRSTPDFERNMKNPMLAMMYGFSVSACMSSALSEPDGMGLGTLGFNPEVAKRMTGEGGFTRFKQHDFADPGNLYYEVRP